jgi:alpha-glucosidase
MKRPIAIDAPRRATARLHRREEGPWWTDAVVYQLYVRSFRDGSGDGIGDFEGIRQGMDHLAALGVDAIWLNPCFASPQRDHGYDISDYFAIEPAYGTVAGLAELVDASHASGIRVLMDMVANHCSVDHAWFQDALAAGPGSIERGRFLFRDGRGHQGEQPPNNWQSVFGGPAWTRITEPDGTPGQWYFHAFDPGQPDFNWRHPDVIAHFEDVLRFWFDLGIDGFRVDVAHGGVKAADLADWPGADDGTGGYNDAMWDQPETHEIYRRWHAIAEEYDPVRYFVGEVWVPTSERLSAYVAEDELHQAFSFDLLVQPWDADRMRAAIDRGLTVGVPGRPPAWVLSNHDVHRVVSRYGQEQHLGETDDSDLIAAARRRGPVDVAKGVRRARAAAMLMLALPGTSYLYQGEELGLPEVFDLPDEARQDPIWTRSGGAELGRDGCRVPLPWTTGSGSFGFSPGSVERTWLPQPAWFREFAVEQQVKDPRSTLRLYQQLIGLRRSLFRGEVQWLEGGPPGLLAFRRGPAACVVNLSDRDVAVPAAWGLGSPTIVSTLDSLGDPSVVPAEAAAWFELLTETQGPAVDTSRSEARKQPHPAGLDARIQ